MGGGRHQPLEEMRPGQRCLEEEEMGESALRGAPGRPLCWSSSGETPEASWSKCSTRTCWGWDGRQVGGTSCMTACGTPPLPVDALLCRGPLLHVVWLGKHGCGCCCFWAALGRPRRAPPCCQGLTCMAFATSPSSSQAAVEEDHAQHVAQVCGTAKKKTCCTAGEDECWVWGGRLEGFAAG